METNYSSLSLSKKLADGGCELESGCVWFYGVTGLKPMEYYLVNNIRTWEDLPAFGNTDCIAFDILNDICCKHVDSFFPKNSLDEIVILAFLQGGEKQRAEDYIWEHCLFNKANKGE